MCTINESLKYFMIFLLIDVMLSIIYYAKYKNNYIDTYCIVQNVTYLNELYHVDYLVLPDYKVIITNHKNKHEIGDTRNCWYHRKDVEDLHFKNVYKQEKFFRGVTMCIFIFLFAMIFIIYNRRDNYVEYYLIP